MKKTCIRCSVSVTHACRGLRLLHGRMGGHGERLLDKNLNPNEDQVKAALAGHICRCSAYPNIIRTVMDSAASCAKQDAHRAEPESVVHIKMPMVRDYSTSGGHLAGVEVIEGANKTVTKSGRVSTGKSQRIR